MIDFIFQVDLSTVYVITRRDFSSPDDRSGSLTAPLGAGFYYTAAEANDAAWQHCVREAALVGVGASGGRATAAPPPHHGEKDGLYRGACLTRDVAGGRYKFEVRVRRLRAKGNPAGGGGVSAGARGHGGVGATRRRASEELRRPRTSPGMLTVVQEEDRAVEEKETRGGVDEERASVKEEEETRRRGQEDQQEEEDDEEEDFVKGLRSEVARRCSSALEKRGGRFVRLWGSIKKRY